MTTVLPRGARAALAIGNHDGAAVARTDAAGGGAPTLKPLADRNAAAPPGAFRIRRRRRARRHRISRARTAASPYTEVDQAGDRAVSQTNESIAPLDHIACAPTHRDGG
jgi:hypothetical protein